MAEMDNYLAVTKGFKILIEVLSPYIAQECIKAYGDDWWNKAVMDKLFDDQKRSLPPSGDFATLVDSLDEQRCLLLIEINWREIFGRKLPRECKNWVIELKGTRNKWAHAGASGMSEAKASRALDTMQLLCEQIEPDAAEEIWALLRKVRYGSEAGSVASAPQAVSVLAEKARKGLDSTVGAANLPSWRDIMEPHPDVAQGRYRNAEFAADLSQVAHGKGSIEYRDPVEFFSRTYITKGMEDLLIQAIQRISGTGGEPVVQLKTAFGGGKTHSMLALYHLLRGKAPLAKIPNIHSVIEKAGSGIQAISDGVNVAVLVGTALSPAKSTRPANMPGVTINTLWGEMAYQLAISANKPQLYNYVKDADKKGVAPGSQDLTNLFDDCGPCLILMDELVAYARQLDGSKGLPAGDLGTFISFIQQVSEAARASKNSMVVASIPESDMEIGGEAGQRALEAIEHTFGRMEAIWKPVAASEGFEVVRRRLFLDCKDTAKRDMVCDAFSRMYVDNAADFPVQAKSLDYRDSMRSCYPIHPEVFDRLYEDWATLPRFQRTRGVLRLMAAVIHHLWMTQDESPMIMPGSLPLNESAVRDELTRYLDEAWNGIVDSEIDGKKSIPYKSDKENPRYGGLLASRRVSRTVMLGSAPDVTEQSARGLEVARIRLGTVQPGENISIFNDALGTLKLKSSYLYSDANDTRYWYDTRPTLSKTVADRIQQIPDTDAYYEIEQRIARWRKTQPFQGLHYCPTSTLDITDDQTLRLVILSPKIAHRSETDASEALSFAKDALINRGTSPRQYKNMLVFMAIDYNLAKPLLQETKRYLAWESVKNDRRDLNLTATQERETDNSISRSNKGVDAKLYEAYCWIFSPRIDLNSDPTTTVWDVDRITGSSESAIEKATNKLLSNESIITQWSPILLKMELDRLLWIQDNDIQIKKLWSHLCTYCYLPKLASYNVLETAIVRGLNSNEYFGIAGGIENGRYLDLKLNTDKSFINQSDYLVKPDVASKQIILENELLRIKDDQHKQNRETEEEPDETSSNQNTDGSVCVNTGNTGSHLDHKSDKTHPVGFYSSSVLDNTRVNRDVNKIVDEIVSHLENVSGCKVQITLEITAHADNGFDVPVQRTISENCRTLHIDEFGFTE